MSTPSKVDFKVVLLGQERVGKTCIMQRFLYGRYREQSPVCLLCCRFLVPTRSHLTPLWHRLSALHTAQSRCTAPRAPQACSLSGFGFAFPFPSFDSLFSCTLFDSCLCANTTGHRRVGAVRGNEQDLLQVCQGCDHLLRFVVALFFCSIPSLRHHSR